MSAADCEGTWREATIPEAPEVPVLRCDGCGETVMIKNGQKVVLIPGRDNAGS